MEVMLYWLDVFKDGVSLPGLVFKCLMISTDNDFYLSDEDYLMKIEKETIYSILFKESFVLYSDVEFWNFFTAQ